MSDLSVFESREGYLSCTPREAFSFISDIRNFERFVPMDKIKDWNAGNDSCNFSVPGLGHVKVAISDKEEFSRIVFRGKVLSDNNFILNVDIDERSDHRASVRVILEAELNPMLKMIASKPARQFLELLVDEMEKFRDWDDTK